MPFNATVVNIMIASPSDVAAEHETTRNVIHEWNASHARERELVLLPMGWQTHASPMMGDRPQAIINKQVLEQCDLLVAVFWTRLGSPTGESPSGTVEEINRHLEAGRPTMIYFSNAPVRPDSVDEAQYKALRQFRTDCESRGLIAAYDSLEDFRAIFARQLTQTVAREFKTLASLPMPDVAEPIGPPPAPEMTAEARQLLMEASQDRHGSVLAVRTSGGFIVQTNGKNLVSGRDPRSEAMWKAAIDELVALDLLEPRGYKGEAFAVTHAGYRAADRLREKA
jgi:hypothetical protein